MRLQHFTEGGGQFGPAFPLPLASDEKNFFALETAQVVGPLKVDLRIAARPHAGHA